MIIWRRLGSRQGAGPGQCSAQASSDSDGTDPEAWTKLYEDLRWIEQHWTAQLQNQEQRVATVLTANGILVSFVAVGAFDRGLQAMLFLRTFS